MDQQAVIDKLRARIPGFECIPGCTACCGHIPWSEFEFNQLNAEQRERFNRRTLKCPFVGDGCCDIHDIRPITCRIFAVTEGLPCPRGVRSRDMLDTETITVLMKEYQRTFFKEDR